MHDIRSIRENPADFDRGLAEAGHGAALRALIGLDDRRKAAVSALQDALERRNAARRRSARPRRAKDEAGRRS